MKVTLENTTKVVEFTLANGTEVPVRIWEGTTAAGIPCHAYILRVAVQDDHDASEFERELQQKRRPTAAVEGIPLRMIL